MITYILLAVIAALYVLGTFQGDALADFCEDAVGSNMTRKGRIMYKWLWPYVALVAMAGTEEDYDQ